MYPPAGRRNKARVIAGHRLNKRQAFGAEAPGTCRFFLRRGGNTDKKAGDLTGLLPKCAFALNIPLLE